MSGDDRVSGGNGVSFSPPLGPNRKLVTGGRCEEGVGEGVWRRGEGVGCEKGGEAEGERRVRRMSTRAGFDRTALRSCLSNSVKCSCPCMYACDYHMTLM